MIVPMKKVSLIVLESEKKQALKKLRKLGLLHIQITEGSGKRLTELEENSEKLEKAISMLSEYTKKDAPQNSALTEDALTAAERIFSLTEEKSVLEDRIKANQKELERLSVWGDVDPDELADICDKGIHISVCEMPASEYKKLGDTVKTVVLSKTKTNVRFIAVSDEDADDETSKTLKQFQLKLPCVSTESIRHEIPAAEQRIYEIKSSLAEYALCTEALKNALSDLKKEIRFEIFETGMETQMLSENDNEASGIAYFVGYLPAQDEDKLKALAKENAWGLLISDPTPYDDAPTELRNNKFVSLIYPLTNFLGTVPGYFEYDISGWFLGFILIFFGIIFGDGGYGLIICGGVAVPIIKALVQNKPISPAFLLIELMGAATVLWGTLTCTWFGLPPEILPKWLCKLSVPVISNVYADKIWYPFWTNGAAGLTTTQNLQILCFSLALIQLSAAHIKGMVRNRTSLKMLGDLGSVLQLVGIFYIVLSLVVNGEVFGLGLVIGAVPIGITAIALIGIGFLMSFVFSNYEGSIVQSVLASLKGIVSTLLGVVNVFSDIVSYIRLWAVGLAGAAISTTVNELASPMLGSLMFMVFAIFILVFGHGLNMILNVLSVIVHGVRLNTLEFSTHLGMSWGGHKYEPFKE